MAFERSVIVRLTADTTRCVEAMRMAARAVARLAAALKKRERDFSRPMPLWIDGHEYRRRRNGRRRK